MNPETQTRRGQGARSPQVLAWGALVAAMLFWAVGFFVNKEILRTLTPFSALSIRFLIAGSILLIPVLRRYGLRLPKRDILPVLITCLLNPIAHYTLSMYGIRMTSASHAAVVGGTFPVAVCLLAGLARLEALTPERIAGVASAAIGVAIIGLVGAEGSEASMLGDGLILIGVIGCAVQIVWLKRIFKRVPPMKLLFYQLVVGVAMFAPAGAIEGFASLARATPLVFLEVAFVAVFGTVLAFGLQYFALQRLSATSVATSSGLVPVFSLALEVLLLGLIPSLPGRILGALFVIAGIVLTQSAEGRLFSRWRRVPDAGGGSSHAASLSRIRARCICNTSERSTRESSD